MDEKVFSIASPDNRQNDRVYAPRNTRKCSIATERLLRCRPTFSKSLMVSVAVSKLGCSPLFFCWAMRKGRWSLLPGRASETADTASHAAYCWWHVDCRPGMTALCRGGNETPEQSVVCMPSSVCMYVQAITFELKLPLTKIWHAGSLNGLICLHSVLDKAGSQSVFKRT